MCIVSMIGDEWMKRVPPNFPWAPQTPAEPYQWPPHQSGPSQAEFDALKREVEVLRDLLKAAKKYDAETGQPDCEVDEKVALLKRIAELVGVDLSEIFPAKPA